MNLADRMADRMAGAGRMQARGATQPNDEQTEGRHSAPALTLKRIFANQTSQILKIHGDGNRSIRFAPFGVRELNKEELSPFDDFRRAAEQGYLKEEKNKAEDSDWWAVPLGLVFFFAVFVYPWVGLVLRSNSWWRNGLLAIVGIPLLSAAWRIVKDRWSWTDISRWTVQSFSLFLVLAVGLVLPSLMVWFASDLPAAFPNWASLNLSDISSSGPLLVGRTLQVLFMIIASLLPALLFFLFDRERLETNKARFNRQMLRFDPNVETLEDVEVKYRPQMDEAYGPRSKSGSGRLAAGTRTPVVIATFLLTLGWVYSLLNLDVKAGVGPDGRPTLLEPADTLALITPEESVIVFGFLGAYFFAVQSVLRGYLRGDLRPKTYSRVTVRVLVAVILAWMLDLAFPAEGTFLFAVAFLVGIVPEEGVQLMQEYLRKSQGLGISADLSEKLPLTKLEGIDLYERARLMDEGVTNIQGLAHHDLVDLMVQTRLPVPRIVDWVDQAILYMHVAQPEQGAQEDEGEENGGKEALQSPGLQLTLRKNGIRTASDLLQAYDAAEHAGSSAKFLERIDNEAGVTEGTLQVILDTLQGEEWLDWITNWHTISPSCLEIDCRTALSSSDRPASGS